MTGEIQALNELVHLGRGAVVISLTEDGRVGVYWDGREGCGITDDSLAECLNGRYFHNELYAQKTESRKDQ